jgi:hypothetical protein
MLIAQPAHVDMSAPSSTHIATYTSRSVFAVLVPCDLDNGPGPVVAERLPLWISRETGPFAEFRPRYPDQVKFLSRQHAYLYWEDEQIFLQDLGSANGSELNGRRIEARLPMPLCDGDRLMFGCEFFSFTLKLERFSSEPTSLRVPVAEEAAHSSKRAWRLSPRC